MARLARRRILLTGASSGIGLAAIPLLAREGAELALVARGSDGLAAAAALARSEGVDARVHPADVTDRDALTAAVDAAAAGLGGLDAVIVNAAALSFGPFEAIPPEDFDRTVAVTLTGAANTARAALPHLRRTRGTIIATVSVAGRAPVPMISPYVAAKHGLRGLMGALRIEMAAQRTGVRVCMVHPGPVDTPIWRNLTSATGRLPPDPPLSYRAEPVARTLVECAVRPRAEVSVGGATLAIAGLSAVARPAYDRLMVAGGRWIGRGRDPAPDPGSLWTPVGEGDVRGGVRGRPSALSPVREALGRALRRRGDR